MKTAEVHVTDPVRVGRWANGIQTAIEYERRNPGAKVVSTRPDYEGGLYLTVLDGQCNEKEA